MHWRFSLPELPVSLKEILNGAYKLKYNIWKVYFLEEEDIKLW